MSTASASLSAVAPGSSQPFMVPNSRSLRVSVLVSMPSIAGTPSAASQSPSDRVAEAWL